MTSRLLFIAAGLAILPSLKGTDPSFEGRYYAGKGDVSYLKLLDTARGMFDPSPRLQTLAMLYTPDWNGLIEGPTWKAWWIQNSYGTTYAALPFWEEPYLTFVQNSQDLWFDQMGDGHHVGGKPYFWLGPDGCLCDVAMPGWIFYKQGDGRVGIHDWGVEFTAAGIVMQAEALLISRDGAARAHYLPKLERCADFIESRRDPRTNLYLAGPAANLLAPSYSGWIKPDGTYGRAYLSGLSVTTIAALDRLIELEKLAGRGERVRILSERRALTRKGLSRIETPEGYFVKSMDPDGTLHGVYGAARHGYFDATVNHDAVCFRVVDDAQARQICAKIASIPGLRPHDLIIANYPALDDLYTKPTGFWEFGRWVNGGHWSTCEGRMIMAYYRVGMTEDARRSMLRILDLARRFRMDNPLTDFGGGLYQPALPINCVYDNWAVPAAFLRGLFEYLYLADRLVIFPHLPRDIARLEQRFPIRFGSRRIYLSTQGSGPVTAVRINGRAWDRFAADRVELPYDSIEDRSTVEIALGGAPLPASAAANSRGPAKQEAAGDPALEPIADFVAALARAGLDGDYAAAHARLILDFARVTRERVSLESNKRLELLPAISQAAADKSYAETLANLRAGLQKVMASWAKDKDPEKCRIAALWSATHAH